MVYDERERTNYYVGRKERLMNKSMWGIEILSRVILFIMGVILIGTLGACLTLGAVVIFSSYEVYDSNDFTVVLKKK